MAILSNWTTISKTNSVISRAYNGYLSKLYKVFGLRAMICIQTGDKFVRSSEFRTDRVRSISRAELFDTPEKRESRIKKHIKRIKRHD